MYECRACGEIVCRQPSLLNGRYCEECFDEIVHGIIVPPSQKPKYQSLASHLTSRQRAKLPHTQ